MKLHAALRLQTKVRDRGLRLRLASLFADPDCDDIAAEAVYAAIVALYEWTLYLYLLMLNK